MTNVILLKTICWFFDWKTLPKEDEDKMKKLVDEFIRLETDDRGFAKQSRPALQYVNEKMTLTE